MKIYLVNDELHETCLGAFSSEEKAEEMIEACRFLGDELTWIDYEVDESLSKLDMLKEMEKNGEKIYSLSTHGGMLWGTDIHWNKWQVSPLTSDSVLDHGDKEDSAIEFTVDGKGWRRYATVKAHSEEEAIEIAEKIVVRL